MKTIYGTNADGSIGNTPFEYGRREDSRVRDCPQIFLSLSFIPPAVRVVTTHVERANFGFGVLGFAGLHAAP